MNDSPHDSPMDACHSPQSLAATAPSPVWRSLPAGIWALGFCSLFMDISSELIHCLLPIFMVSGLGASMLTVGLIEGVAEATAAIVKVFSGTLSDYLGRRKPLLVLGYALAAFSKPIFPLAASLGWVLTARCIDRIGKGIRVAPRDALVAELTSPRQRGAAYGLRQALDSVGAFLGPVLAVVLMIALAGNIRAVLWVAVVPAFMAVLVLLIVLREPPRAAVAGGARSRLRLAYVRRLPARYWGVVALSAVFTLARFSEAFLVLRAQNVGLALPYVPLVMIVMNLLYALAAYPAGAAADRVSPRHLLLLGLALLIVADLLLAAASSPQIVLVGAALWGLHMALTQGLLAKLVADTAPLNLLGTGFGIFNLVGGVALLLASLIAGGLWSQFGAVASFLAGAGFATLTIIALLINSRSGHPRRPTASR